MADSIDRIRWNILSDGEVSRQQDDAFGVHTAYAKLLMQIARDSPTPFSVGLYSSWGTGKTSIIRILQELVDLDTNHTLSVIYLDVWKYSSDPLKRWILLETERQLTAARLVTGYTFQGRTLQSHLEFEEELEDKNRLEIDFKNFGLVLAIALVGAVAAFVVWYYLPVSGKLSQAISALLALAAGGGVIATILTAACKKLGESLSGLIFRRTVRHTSAKPTFSSEKFSQIFRHLVSLATTKPHQRRLVFVFDNLDRCPVDVAIDVIGVIKTFLDEPGCVYVVPCDDEAILAHLRASFKLTDQIRDFDTQASQFLAKVFQMTLRLPPAADFAVEDYVDKELRETKMDDLTNDARDVLVLGYRGETPRQVKRVLNDLIACRGIAEEAERSGLVEQGALTSDLGHLTKMAVLSAKWPSFMRRLADDPVLWTDVMQRIRVQADSGAEQLSSDLQQFLWNTRLVSPETDIRPWLYFRRGSLEKDASLHRRIQEMLQNGASKQMLEVLQDESLRDRKKEILQIAATTVRRWLTTGRRVLLRNATPVLLKASLAEPQDKDLTRDVLDALDYLATNATAEEMEQLFEVKDVIQVSKNAPSWVRHKLLTRFVEFFQPKFPLTEQRAETWKQLIQNGASLDSTDRSAIPFELGSRYSAQPAGEREVLALLEFVSEDLAARSWCVGESLLASIAKQTTFDNTEMDKKRRTVLISFQGVEGQNTLNTVISKIADLVRGPGSISDDAQCLNGISMLLKYDPKYLAQADLTELVDQLFNHSTVGFTDDQTLLVETLFYLDPVLAPEQREKLNRVFERSFVESDPSSARNILSAIGSDRLRVMLSDSRFSASLLMQPRAYKSRYASSAREHRQELFEAFSAVDLLRHPEVFDANFSWDLAIYVETAKRAVELNKTDAAEAGRRVEELCKLYLPASLSSNKELYAALLQLLSEHPEVLTAGLAAIVASCQLVKVLGGDHSAYPIFMEYRLGLPAEQQLGLVRELLQPLSAQQGEWTDLLALIVNDLASEESLDLRNSQLLEDLSDYAFLAAREEWAQAGDVLTKVVALLGSGRQQDYADRSLDSLIALEAEGEETPKMAPFLTLVVSQRDQVRGPLMDKLNKFTQRMLGAAKPDAEKSVVLAFVREFGDSLVSACKPQIEAIASGPESSVGRQARDLLGQ
jgi:KAP family P-loop domain